MGVILLLAIGALLLLAKLRVNTILDQVNDIVGTTGPGGTVSAECAGSLAPFTDALTDLDSRLNVGLSFSAYSEKVADIRVAYDRLQISSLDTTCIRLVASPEEDAFNAYVRAYNTWNTCVGDVSCSNDSITPKLQAEWSKATDLLTGVKRHLP